MKDVLTRIVVPGGSSATTLGQDLVTPVTNPSGGTAGTTDGTTFVFDTTSDNAGLGPNTGTVQATGRYRWTVRARMLGGSATLLLRVRNITDSTTLASKTVTVDSTNQDFVLEADIPDGDAYQFQLDDPSTTVLLVSYVSHEFIPALGQNEQAHTDPESGQVLKRDSSGNLIGNLAIEGEVPSYVSPGLTAIFIVPLDVPLPGYTEPQSVKGRTVTVTATGSPRHTG